MFTGPPRPGRAGGHGAGLVHRHPDRHRGRERL